MKMGKFMRDTLFSPGEKRRDDSFYQARYVVAAREGRKVIEMRDQWKDTVEPPAAVTLILSKPAPVAGTAPAAPGR